MQTAAAILLLSTSTACTAPRDSDSRPKAPVPAYRSRTLLPSRAFFDSRELKMLSRILSAVGLVLLAGEESFLEPMRPPIILVMIVKA
jgi:hypothetical protein